MFLYLIKSCGHANLLGCSKYVNERYINGGESVRDSPIGVNRFKF